MADFNRRFAVAPRLHDAAELDLIFREHHGRKLTKKPDGFEPNTRGGARGTVCAARR